MVGAGDASKNNCEVKPTFEPAVCKYKMHPTKSALRNGSDQPLKLKQLQPTEPLGWVRTHGFLIQIQIQIQTQIKHTTTNTNTDTNPLNLNNSSPQSALA